MSLREITVQPLTAAAFAPFGEVLDASGAPDSAALLVRTRHMPNSKMAPGHS